MTFASARPGAAISASVPSAWRFLASASFSATFSAASASVSSWAARCLAARSSASAALTASSSFGAGLGGDHHRLLAAVGLGEGAHVLDGFFLLGHGAFDHDALADHVGDGLLLHFHGLFFIDALQFDFFFARDHFQHAGAGDALFLDGDGALAVVLRHFLLTRGVFLLHQHDLFGLQAGQFGLGAFFGLHLLGFGLFAGAHAGHFAVLAGLGVGLLALQFQDRFAGFHVLLLDAHFLVTLQFIGADAFNRGQLGDLLDALGVQDVMAVQLLDRGLFEIVDGRVFQDVAGQVAADLANDVVAEAVARLVQVDEVHRLADGLQRLGELGREQVFQRLLAGSAGAADRLGHLQHVFLGLVHAQEKGDLDVGADVVAADQAVLAKAFDLDGLERDLHQFLLVDDGVDHAAGEADVRLGAQGVDDHCVTLFDFMVEAREHCQGAEQNDDADGGCNQHDVHGFPSGLCWCCYLICRAGGLYFVLLQCLVVGDDHCESILAQ
jgi:hypothetical protein